MNSRIFFVCTFLLFCAMIFEYGLEHERTDQHEPFRQNCHDRKSITFIMGKDKGSDRFYSNAIDHFKSDTLERTDLVVRSCRSLEAVITYLNKSQVRGSNPWSTINIVAHGNPQTGLNVEITERGHRATPRRLVQALIQTSIPRLEEGVTDSTTNINFWSCGIGKSMMVTLSLKRIFTPASGAVPRIYCSPHFVIFDHSPITGAPVRIKASYWPYYFKRGYRPGNTEIANAFEQMYPEVDLDWRAILEANDKSSAISVNEYHIPVSYIRIYPTSEDRPGLSSEKEKVEWALSQKALITQIEDTGIPVERFQWTVNRVRHQLESGATVPAVKAIGMATVLYVLDKKEQAPKA